MLMNEWMKKVNPVYCLKAMLWVLERNMNEHDTSSWSSSLKQWQVI